MIKNIIFDLNKTLVVYKKSGKSDKYLKNFGICKDTFWQTRKKYKVDYRRGKIDFNEFVKLILRDLKLNPKLIKVAKQLNHEDIILVTGMKGVLKKLEKNYKLLMLAGDGRGSLEYKVSKFNFDKYFYEIYASCYEGFEKNDPRLYERMIKKSKIIPTESLFIDDVKGHTKIAKDLGLKTVLFKDAKNLKDQLRKLKIKI